MSDRSCETADPEHCEVCNLYSKFDKLAIALSEKGDHKALCDELVAQLLVTDAVPKETKAKAAQALAQFDAARSIYFMAVMSGMQGYSDVVDTALVGTDRFITWLQKESEGIRKLARFAETLRWMHEADKK